MSLSEAKPNETQEMTQDIEHALVPDDPRAWGYARKTLILIIVSSASMLAGIASTIQNPANAQIEQDLHASGSDVSWSISVFALSQGLFPIAWSAISEILGRKFVYLISMSLFVVGSVIVAISKSIGLVIAMRVVQAAGSSAVMTIAAATLADIYESHERGTKMGIYYSAPLLGVSIGPFLGGAFTQAFGWRAVFFFATITGGIVWVSLLIFFKDTFRKERSLVYQNALRRCSDQRQSFVAEPNRRVDNMESSTSQQILTKKRETRLQNGRTANFLRIGDINSSFMNVNPLLPMIAVLKRLNNNVILLASGLLFGFTNSLAYSCARTLSIWYGYNALYTGLVLLSYGIGSIFGSIFGGRWSDRALVRFRDQHAQQVHAEMRLRSTYPAMPWLPLCAIGYAWICQTHQSVAAICVMLFIAGISAAWMFSICLAYIVDANVGCSSTSVAANSLYRGVFAFIAIEISIPLQKSIGDGGLYTFWAGLLVIVDILVLLVIRFGKEWREKHEETKEGMVGQDNGLEHREIRNIHVA